MTASNLGRMIGSAACLLAVAAAVPAFDKVIDSPMYHLPDLPTPRTIKLFPEGAKDLWLKALARPDADTKCRAAGAIALAQRRGYKGLESTIPALVAELDKAEQAPAVRLAIAETLITLKAKDSAPSLLRQTQTGSSDLRELVEPVLAEWDYRPAREMWLARLDGPATPQRNLILAIRCLGKVKEAKAADRLRELALAQRSEGPIRLEAARVLAKLRTEGLEQDAAGLLGDTSARGLVNRLVAASLLQEHSAKPPIELLQKLAKDSEPAVATLAVARLIQIDPTLVVPMLADLLARPDANLRGQAVAVLFRVPSEPHIGLLAARLDDTDTDVRIQAREAMFHLAARKEFRDAVIREGVRTLATRQWRALEQATILLTLLDYKPAAALLTPLLKFDRPEVFVSAAWGLRKLDDPAQLAGVHKYVSDELPRLRNGKRLSNRKEVSDDDLDHQLSQLNQFLGQRKYKDADGLLRDFIPKHADRLLPESRAAAIWGLGMIHEGAAVADLAAPLLGRLNDTMSIPPEADQVRLMCAISLGRMHAESALEALQRNVPIAQPSGSAIHNACGWAVAQIKKETWPAPKDVEMVDRDWFLRPEK